MCARQTRCFFRPCMVALLQRAWSAHAVELDQSPPFPYPEKSMRKFDGEQQGGICTPLGTGGTFTRFDRNAVRFDHDFEIA